MLTNYVIFEQSDFQMCGFPLSFFNFIEITQPSIPWMRSFFFSSSKHFFFVIHFGFLLLFLFVVFINNFVFFSFPSITYTVKFKHFLLRYFKYTIEQFINVILIFLRIRWLVLLIHVWWYLVIVKNESRFISSIYGIINKIIGLILWTKFSNHIHLLITHTFYMKYEQGKIFMYFRAT